MDRKRTDAGTINYAVYENNSEYRGQANVKLPDKSNKTITVNGAGIPGDVELPVVGHYNALSATFTFTDANKDTYKMCEQRKHTIMIYAAKQTYNAVAGRMETHSYKHIMDLYPKTRTSGEIAPASLQGASVDFALLSLKSYIDNELVEDFDPLNFRDVDSSGNDALAEVRSALGK